MPHAFIIIGVDVVVPYIWTSQHTTLAERTQHVHVRICAGSNTPTQRVLAIRTSDVRRRRSVRSVSYRGIFLVIGAP
jgi:hypothetical protein